MQSPRIIWQEILNAGYVMNSDIIPNAYIKRNVKIIEGYIYSSFYDFNNHILYLTTKKTMDDILSFKIDPLLFEILIKKEIITFDNEIADSNPFIFNYDLFDDKYSYQNCTQVYLEITDKCNLNCIHCYAKSLNCENHSLSIPQIKRIISNMDINNQFDIRLTGGEPFLNHDFSQIIEYIHYAVTPSKAHSIVTNGSFDLDIALNAIELGFKLQISVYGTNSATFKKFTSCKSTSNEVYKKINDNLKQLSLRKKNNSVQLLYNINRVTLNGLATFCNFADNLGFRYILNRPASTGRAIDNWSYLKLCDNLYSKYVNVNRIELKDFRYHLCHMNMVNINTKGDVTPCSYFRTNEFMMGNMLKEKFSTIWNNENYRKFRDLNPDNIELCSRCEFKYACTGGCCGESYGETGNILSAYPWCIIKPYSGVKYIDIPDNVLYSAHKIAAGVFDFTNQNIYS